MNALVTGGARGIGRATAMALLARGARVAIGDVDLAAAEATAREIGAAAFRLDVSDRASFSRFVGDAEARFGPTDLLVNNAGIMPLGRFLDGGDASHRRTIDVNLWGVILGMQLVLPGMVRRGGGHVINVASMMGRLHVPGAAVYGATKTAVVALGRAVREELDGTGVRVSTVLPTMVRTELASGVPLGRGLPAVGPDDVAAAIVRCQARPRDEVFVPRWLAAADVAIGIAPDRAMRWIRRLMDGNRVVTKVDHAERAAYEARIRTA